MWLFLSCTDLKKVTFPRSPNKASTWVQTDRILPNVLPIRSQRTCFIFTFVCFQQWMHTVSPQFNSACFLFAFCNWSTSLWSCHNLLIREQVIQYASLSSLHPRFTTLLEFAAPKHSQNNLFHCRSYSNCCSNPIALFSGGPPAPDPW